MANLMTAGYVVRNATKTLVRNTDLLCLIEWDRQYALRATVTFKSQSRQTPMVRWSRGLGTRKHTRVIPITRCGNIFAYGGTPYRYLPKGSDG